MKHKLIAAAVAGAFVLPGVALAQVTLSGKFGAHLVNAKITNPSAARVAAGTNNSSTFLADNTSIIRFAAQENLGGGLTAIGQYEIRPLIDGGAPTGGAVPVGSTSPVNFVGLRSTNLGTIRLGTMTTWGAVGGGFSAASTAQFSSSGIMNYVQLGGANTSFSASRQRNVIQYDTPNFNNGFRVQASWSSAPLATADLDMNTAMRKGSAWYLTPEFSAGGWKVGWSHANIKTEVAAAAAFAPVDLKADKLYVETNLAGFDIGLTWAKIKAKHGAGFAGPPAIGAGTALANVSKWLLPVRYRMGNNTFGFQYGRSNDDKVQTASDQSARYTALTYAYNFSRRTNVAATYSRMSNAAGGSYQLSSSGGAYSATNAGTNLGENQRWFSVGLNHNF
jgi:predicted porin